MAAKLKKFWDKYENSVWGIILQAAIYAGMLILIMLFFTGNGQFLYEL